ncbi:MAG: hypothetical protein KAQ97_02845 [Candidatus Fermentibacteraceae bacterium]|nr:hypothetical protein [Candidatus Fermentibacteraceae bacterium]
MNDILLTETLPYSEAYFEKISVRFLNLRELARGALDSRDLHRDGYWRIDSRKGVVAYHAIKNGTPYRFIGRDAKGLEDFLHWLENDVKEMHLSYYFVENNVLKYLLRCWTDQPVLRKLSGSKGQIIDLYEKVVGKGESGLIRTVKDDITALFPIINGKADVGWLPGRTLDGPGIWEYLEYEASTGCSGYFYPGETQSLSGVGLDEVSLLLSAFNSWYIELLDIWLDCFMQSVHIFGSLRKEIPLLGKLVLIPDEGLQQKRAFDDPQRFPEVIIYLVKAISKENENPDKCIQLFRDVNSDQRHALTSAGLGELMEKKKT